MPEYSQPDLSKSRETAPLRHEIRTIEALDAFQALRREWDELAAAAEEYFLCATYQYCELAAARVLAKGAVIVVIRVYDDRDLLAIWPLAIHRQGLLRIAKALTCGSGEEYGGPLVKGTAGKAVFTAALDAVMQVHADVLEVSQVQGGSLLQESLESVPQSWLLPILPKRLGDLPGYSIRLRGFAQWDEFAATLPTALRSELRYKLKRLSAKGHAEFGWCTTPGDAETVLTWLFANKRRWAGARGWNTQYLMDDQVRDFFIALARRTDLSNIPLVTFVKVDGAPVAASVNLVGARFVEGFVTTYDEAFGTYSVGSLLTDFIVRWVHANGRDFDFRPFYSDYKARWANHQTRHQTRFVFLSARGRLKEIPLLAFQVSRVARKSQKAAVAVLETVKARIGLSLMSAKSKEPLRNEGAKDIGLRARKKSRDLTVKF